MNKFQGLENLAPSIVKFPFVTAIKAVVNLKLGKKIPSSLAKIFALIAGLAIGYLFPEIGSFMSFFLNLFMTNPMNTKISAGITYACSMVLSASVLMFVTKKVFQYYYMSKYGVTNPELRLTESDRKTLNLLFEDEKLSKPEIIEKINDIEVRIKYLVNKIRLYKLTGNDEGKETAKFALSALKRGDFLIFEEYFETSFKSRGKKTANFDRTRNSYDDDFSANNTDDGYYGRYGGYDYGNEYEDSTEDSSEVSSEYETSGYYRGRGYYSLRPEYNAQSSPKVRNDIHEGRRRDLIRRADVARLRVHEDKITHGASATSSPARISLNLYGIKRENIKVNTSPNFESGSDTSQRRLEIVFG